MAELCEKIKKTKFLTSDTREQGVKRPNDLNLSVLTDGVCQSLHPSLSLSVLNLVLCIQISLCPLNQFIPVYFKMNHLLQQ